MPAHDSRAIANIFVDKAQSAGVRLTIMPLIQYVYLAHGWTLGYTGEPLIKDPVEAWTLGPVVPAVYEAFYDQGVIIGKKATNWLGMRYSAQLNEDEDEIVNLVSEKCRDVSSYQLHDLTRGANTPWRKYEGEHFHPPIPTDEIRDYYRERVRQLQLQKVAS